MLSSTLTLPIPVSPFTPPATTNHLRNFRFPISGLQNNGNRLYNSTSVCNDNTIDGGEWIRVDRKSKCIPPINFNLRERAKELIRKYGDPNQTLNFNEHCNADMWMKSNPCLKTPATYPNNIPLINSKDNTHHMPSTPKSKVNKENITSIMFHNFPEHWEKRDLWLFLKRYGNLHDIFIPYQKRLKNGRRFGFARFEGVDDIDFMLKRMNTIFLIDSWFRAYKAYDRFAVPKNIISKITDPPINPTTNATFEKMNNRISKESLRDGRSFQEVVDGSVKASANHGPNNGKWIRKAVDKEKFRVINVDDENINREVIDNAIIGEVTKMELLENFSSLCKAENLNQIEIKYLGGMDIMVIFDSPDHVDLVLNSGEHCLHKWLVNVRRCGLDYCSPGRITWLSVTGVPVQYWKEKTFRSIANWWGHPIVFQNCSLAGNQNLVIGRILIKITEPELVNDTIKVISKNSVFFVYVSEDSKDVVELDFESESVSSSVWKSDADMSDDEGTDNTVDDDSIFSDHSSTGELEVEDEQSKCRVSESQFIAVSLEKSNHKLNEAVPKESDNGSFGAHNSNHVDSSLGWLNGPDIHHSPANKVAKLDNVVSTPTEVQNSINQQLNGLGSGDGPPPIPSYLPNFEYTPLRSAVNLELKNGLRADVNNIPHSDPINSIEQLGHPPGFPPTPMFKHEIVDKISSFGCDKQKTSTRVVDDSNPRHTDQSIIMAIQSSKEPSCGGKSKIESAHSRKVSKPRKKESKVRKTKPKIPIPDRKDKGQSSFTSQNNTDRNSKKSASDCTIGIKEFGNDIGLEWIDHDHAS